MMKKIDEELINAAQKGELDDVKQLIKKGADCTADNNCAIQWAAASGHMDTVKYLISQGADCTDDDNCAIRFAAQKGHLDTVKYLVSQGANGTARENAAIKQAAYHGHLDTVKYLVSQGADGKKAIRYADNLDIFNYLKSLPENDPKKDSITSEIKNHTSSLLNKAKDVQSKIDAVKNGNANAIDVKRLMMQNSSLFLIEDTPSDMSLKSKKNRNSYSWISHDEKAMAIYRKLFPEDLEPAEIQKALKGKESMGVTEENKSLTSSLFNKAKDVQSKIDAHADADEKQQTKDSSQQDKPDLTL